MTAIEDAPIVGRNLISEFFGHQVYPVVAATPEALADQVAHRCPFLTSAHTVDTQCVKADSSRGVCSVSTLVDRTRHNWLVCPNRALDTTFMGQSARRIFGYSDGERMRFIAAPTLRLGATRASITEGLANGDRVIVYFQEKLGGELSLRKTEATPEFSFDWTLVEVVALDPELTLGRFGILELQTMDFHGSYKHAVIPVNDVLQNKPDEFADWLATSEGLSALSRKMEGPNLSNVFKRTFYQIAYKFQIAGHNDCAGAGIAIPKSVWQSWLRHLGKPDVVDVGDGTFILSPRPDTSQDESAVSWILVFEVDETSAQTPRPLKMWRQIRVDPQTLVHLALTLSPAAALASGGPVDGVLTKALDRVSVLWPEALPSRHKSKRGAKRVKPEGSLTITLDEPAA